MPDAHPPHAELLNRFYSALNNRDAEGMAACYHQDARFTDPAFGDLKGPEIGGMWRMLLGRASDDLSATWTILVAHDDRGEAKCEIKYPFSRTGRQVHNHIHGHFRFKDGLIIEQRDQFSMQKWLGMALGGMAGMPGFHLLYASIFRRKARQALEKFMAKNS